MVPLVTNKAASFPVNSAALVCRADENNENQMLNFAEQRVSYLHLYKTLKLMIIVVSPLSYPRYCLSTDQLVYGCATQTTETNIANET